MTGREHLEERLPSQPSGKAAQRQRRHTRMGSVQREHVRCREVRHDVLCLAEEGTFTGRAYRAVLEVRGANYTLLSEEDQETLMTGYRTFLKSLTFPVQILIRNHPLDLSSYVKRLDRVIAD